MRTVKKDKDNPAVTPFSKEEAEEIERVGCAIGEILFNSKLNKNEIIGLLEKIKSTFLWLLKKD